MSTTAAPRSAARRVLIMLEIASTVFITVLATILSFLAIKHLAVMVGWPADTAWMVQPVIELFFIAGTVESALRTLERRTDVRYPERLTYAALVVSLVLNVVSHCIGNLTRPGWQVGLVGVVAAIVPLAQIGALHLLADRLRALATPTVAHATVPEPTGDSVAPVVHQPVSRQSERAVSPPVVSPLPEVVATVSPDTVAVSDRPALNDSPVVEPVEPVAPLVEPDTVASRSPVLGAAAKEQKERGLAWLRGQRAAGLAPSGADVGRQFGRDPKWGQRVVAALDAEPAVQAQDRRYLTAVKDRNTARGQEQGA